MTSDNSTFFTVEKKTVLGTYYLHVEFDTVDSLKNWVDWLDSAEAPFSIDVDQVPFEPAKPSRPTARSAPRAQNGAPRAMKAKSGVACDICGGPTWDNTTDKRTPTAPDYRCRDRDNCGAAAWINDGELTWKEGRPV